MPCKSAKARKLLRDGKAKVDKLVPFTIQLLFECENQVQDVAVGIDKGYKYTGFSCTCSGKILLSGVINHRTDIKKKMEVRANNRRQRRNRKWYRPPRFDNRSSSKRSDRVPPSIKANAEEVIRVISALPLPVSSIIVEDVQIDIAKLNNPDLEGKEYQKSNRLSENLRLATLIRDDFQCQYCGKKNVSLEAHHIMWQENGGKNTIKNLITLCKPCHKRVHKKEIEVGKGVPGFKDRIAQKTMQGKKHMYTALRAIAPINLVFGYQTAEYRKSLGLPKEHDIDALCIATLSTGEVIEWDRDNFYDFNFRPRQTRRQYFDQPRKGIGRVKYQVNEELCGFRKGDIVLVKGKYRKQINSIYSEGYLAFSRIKGEPSSASPINCRLLERQKTVTVWSNAG